QTRDPEVRLEFENLVAQAVIQ
ncbi:MAG: hypothetical protein RL328_1092, partial [Acidobacteriota bacterium]